LYSKNRRKSGAKSRQDRRKILCKARANAKSANFTLKNLAVKFRRPKPAEKEAKDQKAAIAKSSR
jgi:hypothetical protein